MSVDGGVEKVASEEIRTLLELATRLSAFEVPLEQRVVFAVGFGWWMRIIRTADGIRRLHDAGLSQEAAPLLRTLLHHTAALEWLRLYPDEALDALREEQQQRRHDLAEHASRRDWQLDKLELGQRPPKKKLDGLRDLREFERMADRIGATNLYVAYKVESAYAHPSGLSADTYIEPVEGGVPQLRDSPSIDGVPLRATAMFAATATRILGILIGDQRLTAAADRTGDALGVETRLPGHEDPRST